jgi:DNA-binding beta-propeller fold protein YncE
LNGSGDLALDLADGKIYFSSQFGNTISDANLDGTDQQLLLSGLSEPSGIALDIASGKLYWTDWGGTIEDSNLDGSDRQTLLTGGVQGQSGLALDLSNGKMYWTTWYSPTTLSTGQLWSANLDGSDPEALLSGLNEPVGISLLSGSAPPIIPEPATSSLVAIGTLGIIGYACRQKGRVG